MPASASCSQLKGRTSGALCGSRERAGGGGLRGRLRFAGLGFAGAAEEDGCCPCEAGMVQQQTRQFAARVAADACDGGAGGDCSRLRLFEYVCRC